MPTHSPPALQSPAVTEPHIAASAAVHPPPLSRRRRRRQSNDDEPAAAALRATVARVTELTALKLDAATAAFVQRYERHVSRKDNTCQFAAALPGVRIGVWVNATKNLRLKCAPFPTHTRLI